MLYKVLILYKDSELQQRWISEIAQNSKYTLSEIQGVVNKRKSELKAFSENDLVHSSKPGLSPVDRKSRSG